MHRIGAMQIVEIPLSMLVPRFESRWLRWCGTKLVANPHLPEPGQCFVDHARGTIICRADDAIRLRQQFKELAK